MSDITTAVRTICLMAAGIGLLENITSGTKLRTQMEFILKLVLAAAIAAPFVSGSFDLSDISINSISEAEDYTDVYQQELAAQTSQNISDVLSAQLKAAGIAVGNIRTEVNISQDGSISINKVIVETEEPEAAARLIRNSLGQETEVINGKV